MDKLKNLAIALSLCFAISFLDGFAGWGIMDTGFAIVIGVIMLVCLVWMDIILFKKKEGEKSAIERLKDEVL